MPASSPVRGWGWAVSDETQGARGRRPRRAAPRPPVRIGAISLALAATAGVAAVGAAVVGAGLAAPTIGAARPEPVTSVVPVASTELVCPEPGAAPGSRVLVAAAAMTGLPGQEGAGLAEIVDVPEPLTPVATLPGPGRTTALNVVGEGSPPVAIRATGSVAPGILAAQVGRTFEGQGRGLTSAACLAAGSSWWFMGGGAVLGQLTRIVLVNPESSPALVDVTVYGADGPVDLPSTRGIALPSRSQSVLRLDRLIPGVAAGAVHVTASSGRVAVAVNDSVSDGLIPLGTDWVQPSAEPARRLLIPGVSDGAGARELRLLAPVGSATVGLRVYTDRGSFVPVGYDAIDVPAGRLVSIDVTDALKGEAATIEVTADAPVVAGVRQAFGTGSVARETSYTASVPVSTGPTAATGLPGRVGLDTNGFTRIWITAPDGAARVRVTILPADGRAASAPTIDRVVEVPARRVVAIDIDPPEGRRWFTALVTPETGGIVAAHRVLLRGGGGSLVTGYAWQPLRVTVTLPTSVEDIARGVPQR